MLQTLHEHSTSLLIISAACFFFLSRHPSLKNAVAAALRIQFQMQVLKQLHLFSSAPEKRWSATWFPCIHCMHSEACSEGPLLKHFQSRHISNIWCIYTYKQPLFNKHIQKYWNTENHISSFIHICCSASYFIISKFPQKFRWSVTWPTKTQVPAIWIWKSCNEKKMNYL